MIDKTIKKKLIERRELLNNNLIIESIIQKRIGVILESVSNVENIEQIPLRERKKITLALYREFHRLHQTGLINESFDLWGSIQSLFGNLGYGVLEGLIIEPLVNTLLSKIGLGGFFKDTLVSFISTNPSRIVEAFKSCESMTKLLAESISEAVVMMIQKSTGTGGFGYDVIRNVLGKTVKETAFIQGIETSLASTVCEAFDKFIVNTGSVKDKLSQLKSDLTTEK